MPLVQSVVASGSLTASLWMCRAWNRVLCKGLTELRPQILRPSLCTTFPNLKHIDLGQCPSPQAGQITALQALPCLDALRALLLDQEQILAVAAEIAQLRGLTSLDVSR